MAATESTSTALRNVAHEQSNNLNSVIALLAAVSAQIEALDIDDEQIEKLVRLMHVARLGIGGAVAAFDPHI